MIISVLLFAGLRERAAASRLRIELEDGATVKDALEQLDHSGPLEGLMRALSIQIAVNREYATRETVLSAEDELALIPPVSGGAHPAREYEGEPGEGALEPRLADGEELVSSETEAQLPGKVHVRISAQPLRLDPLLQIVGDDRAGAIVAFQGVTREVSSLQYEAYVEMAEPQIEAIARRCLQANDAFAAAVEHRIGIVPLRHPSVLVVVSAAHRQQAFGAASQIIDEVKAMAPIWKREIRGDSAAAWMHD